MACNCGVCQEKDGVFIPDAYQDSAADEPRKVRRRNPEATLDALELRARDLQERVEALEAWIAAFEDTRQSQLDEATKLIRSNLIGSAE